MSNSIQDLLNLIRESDELEAREGSEKAKQPGEKENGEADAPIDSEIKDLDKPMADSLLPEEEKIVDADGDSEKAPEAPAQPQAGDSSAEISDDAEVSADELAADVDPDVAEIIRALGESDESAEDEDEEEKEDSEDEESEDSEEKSDDDKDADFSDVENISLSDDEAKDASNAASADDKSEDSEKKEEAALPGSEDLSDEQKCTLRRLFDNCVAEAVQAKFPKLIKIVESKLNEKFRMVSEARDNLLNQKVNDYLKYVVETWKESNKPQLHTAAQIKVAKKIFESLKVITESLDIETIDAKVEIVREYEEKIAKLQKESNKLVSDNTKLIKELSIRDRAIVIEEASKGLPLTEVSGFKAAVSNIKADDLQTFKENVQAVRASLAGKPKKSESIRATNESLALQGGIKGGSSSPQNLKSEGDLIANLIPDASEEQ